VIPPPMAQKDILAFIDDHFEEIKKESLPIILECWANMTPEKLQRKWKQGAKEHRGHGEYSITSIPDPIREIEAEITDAFNYTMDLLLKKMVKATILNSEE
jgi:hypothetical protein